MRTRLTTTAAAIAFGCAILGGASQVRANEGRSVLLPSGIVIVNSDHDRDDKKNKGRKIRRHGYVAPPAWYNGSNGYFAGGKWHHNHVTHTRVRDRDHDHR